MSEIKWQDFLNILTLKGLDTGAISSDVDNGFNICYNANRLVTLISRNSNTVTVNTKTGKMYCERISLSTVG